ncbi:histidine kinase, partial [Microcoleus sp. HI-ES]|nr:histidine kinase [Microcoleus sp. HI-ES]
MFAVVMFLKVKIPQSTAELFKDLALSVKTALSMPDEQSVFDYSANPTTFLTNNNIYETQLLEYQVANLIQLLDFSEQEMLRQATRFQQSIN